MRGTSSRKKQIWRPALVLLAAMAALLLLAMQFSRPVEWKKITMYLVPPLSVIAWPGARYLVNRASSYSFKNLRGVSQSIQTVVLALFLGMVLTHLIAVLSLLPQARMQQQATVIDLRQPYRRCDIWTLQISDGKQVAACRHGTEPYAVGDTVPVEVRESALAYEIRPLGKNENEDQRKD